MRVKFHLLKCPLIHVDICVLYVNVHVLQINYQWHYYGDVRVCFNL